MRLFVIASVRENRRVLQEITTVQTHDAIRCDVNQKRRIGCARITSWRDDLRRRRGLGRLTRRAGNRYEQSEMATTKHAPLFSLAIRTPSKIFRI